MIHRINSIILSVITGSFLVIISSGSSKHGKKTKSKMSINNTNSLQIEKNIKFTMFTKRNRWNV